MSTLIMAFLQLEPGIFALFSHFSYGKFKPKKRALLTTFYMLGVETVSACLFICCLLFVNLFFLYTQNPATSFIAWIFVGILIALALVSFFCYYRPEKTPSSRLYIPRKCADTLEHYAAKANSRSDAFTLGALTSVLELPFSFILYLVAAFSSIELFVEFRPTILLALLFALSPLLPLILIRLRFRAGYNLADILRSRFQNKSAVRLVLSLSYFTLAVLFIMEYFNGTI